MSAARGRSELHGLGDAELPALATNERRAVVTENVADFVELHRTAVVSGRPHFGIIFTSARRFPRTLDGIGTLVHARDAYLVQHPADDGHVNQTLWLADPGDDAHTR